MPVIIKADIQAGSVIAKLENARMAVQGEMRKTIERLAIQLTGKIKSEKLSGQVLNVRTGTLRRSISYQIQQTGTDTIAKIGTNVKYAAAHEYGFNGTASVRNHVRNITQAFGKQINPVMVQVKAHNRKMNIKENSFARSALNEMQKDIENEIISTVNNILRM